MSDNSINPSKSIPCIFCRYSPVRARTTEIERTDSYVIIEHKYICPKCQNVARAVREKKEIKPSE